MSHIFPRHCKQVPPVAVRGQGCYLFDDSGKQYLDASGGAAVSCLGHGDQEIIDAVKAQLDNLAYAHTGFFTSSPAEALADLLIAHAPGDLDRVYLVSGGSEAMEAALKLARQYFVEKGEPNRGRLIARKQSYHGNTMGALSAGGNEWRRAQFGPLLIDMSHIDPCYEYRLRRDERIARGLRAAGRQPARGRIAAGWTRKRHGLCRRTGGRGDGGGADGGTGLFPAHPRDLRSVRHPADP